MQNLKEYEIQNNKLSDTIKKLRYDLQECQKQQEDLCQLQANIKNRLEELEKEQKNSHAYKMLGISNSNLKVNSRLVNAQENFIYVNLINRKNITDNFIICPQVSLGAFINFFNDDDNDENPDNPWFYFDRLRADFLFIKKEKIYTKGQIKSYNSAFLPFAILEFHGSGHKHSLNDELKIMACNKAGIKFFLIDNSIYQAKQDPNEYYKIDIQKLNNFVDNLEKELLDKE